MIKHNKIILLFTTVLLVLLLGLTMTAAADTNTTTSQIPAHIEHTTPQTTQEIQTTDNNKINKEVQSNTTSKKVVKKEKKTKQDKNIKQATINKEVNNYEELKQAITDADNDNTNEYNIKLNQGNYTYNTTLIWGTGSTKQITINMNKRAPVLQGSYVPFIRIENGYSLILKNSSIDYRPIDNYGNITVETTDYIINNRIYNYGNIILENMTPKKINGRDIIGNITLKNCNITNLFTIGRATNIILINSIINNTVKAYDGNVYLINCTVNASVTANQNLTISDNTILGNNAKLSGKLITNKTDAEIFGYLSSYNGNYTIENMTITGSSNNGNLTLINSVISSSSTFENYGNLVLINSTSVKTLTNRDGNITISNSVINGQLNNYDSKGNIYLTNNTIINNTISNSAGNLTIDDTVIINGKITGNGKLITNNTQAILSLETLNENYTLTNATITGQKTNRGNLTLKNSTINGTITNNGNLTISDDTVFGSNAIINNYGTLNTNRTDIYYYFSDYAGNYTINNFTITTSRTNTGNLTLNNCIINNSIRNTRGNLTLNNCTINNIINSRRGNLILNNCMINGTISGDGNITISDDTVFGSNAGTGIMPNGKLIINSTLVNDYEQLRQAINNATQDHTIINLLKGTYTSNGVITLENQTGKNITINGNGQTINGNNQTFLNITENYTVTVNNLNIINCTNNNTGGAINNYGTLTLNNNTFINNTCGYVFIDGNVTSDKDVVTGSGGAVNNNGTLTLNNNIFINNTSNEYGGAVNNNGTLTANNNIFQDNYSGYDFFHHNQGYSGGVMIPDKRITTGRGGAVNNNGTLTLNGNIFTNNTAELTGDSINSNGSLLEVYNNTFTNNNPKRDAVLNSYDMVLLLNNNTFTDNNGCLINYNGKYVNGVIDSNSYMRANNNVFINNSVSSGRPAIRQKVSSGILNNNTFINNTVSSGVYNGFLYLYNSTTVSNSTFISNTGHVLSGDHADITIINCSFINNNGTDATVYGGYNITVDNCTFSDNYGGLIAIYGNASVINSKFYNNTVITKSDGDLVYNKLFDTRNGFEISYHNYQRVANNTYIGNNLTVTADTPENVVINGTDYMVIIPFGVDSVYNTTVDNGNVTVVVNDDVIGVYPVADGKVNITIPKTSLKAGDNEVTYRYTSPDNSYTTLRLANTVTKQKEETVITVDPISNTLSGNKVNITGKLVDVNNNPIVNASISVVANNIGYDARTNSNGVFTVSDVSGIQGYNNISVSYSGDDNYLNSENNTQFIGLVNTRITLNPVGNITVNQPVTVTGTLTDSNNIPLRNVNLTITVADNAYNVTSSDTGVFTKTINLTAPGTYTINVAYNGENEYLPSNTTGTFNITKLDTVITTTNITGYLGSNVTFNASIKDADNNVITSGIVVIKLNNKTEATVNITGDGRIIYNLNLTPERFGKEGYNITYVYGGSNTTNSVRANARLNIIPFSPKVELNVNSTDYGDTVVMIVKITNGQGYNALSGNIRFKINGITYKINKEPVKAQITNGSAILSFYASKKFIGNNNITVLYSGNGKFNSIAENFTNILTINSHKQTVINTTPVTAKLGRNITINTKITDKNGNPLTQGTVAIKINGKTFGHANIVNGTINYTQYMDPAKFSAKNYTVTIKFGGKGKYSPATVNTTLSIAKNNPKFTYTTTTAKANTSTKITVKIADGQVNAINGTVGLKINGNTYKVNKQPVIVKPVNGVATFTVNTNGLKTNNNITFTYSGDREFEGLKQTFNNGLRIRA